MNSSDKDSIVENFIIIKKDNLYDFVGNEFYIEYFPVNQIFSC